MRVIRWCLLGLLMSLPCGVMADTADELYQQTLKLLAQGQSQQALMLAQRLKDAFPHHPKAQEADYLMARAWESQYQAKQALQAYRRFLRLRVNSVHRVDAQLKVSVIQSGLKDAPDVLKLMLQAMNARSLSKDKQAVAYLQALVQQYPRSHLADDALNMMAYIQLVDMHDMAAAAQSYRRLLQTYATSNYVDSATYGLGVALEEEKKWQQARVVYQRLKQKHMSSLTMLGLSFAKDNYLSRVWFNKASARLTHLQQRQMMEEKGRAFIRQYGFILGVGDRLVWDQPVGSGKHYRPVWSLSAKYGVQAQAVSHWITRDTDWQWETPDRLQALVRAGHTPMIVDWYFGDDISPDFIRQHRQDYLQHIRERLIPLIRGLPEVWVMLEPEFNKRGVASWQGWGDLSVQVVDMIHQAVPAARVGLVLGNWVDEQDDAWVSVMAQAVEHSDFIGFQEMISSLDAQTAMDVGWNPVDRSLRLLKYLQQEFHKPIYMAYLAVSSASSWEDKQARMISRFRDAMADMAFYGVIGASYFALLDDPLHQGWFVEAEKTLGLLSATGQAKPALKAWKSWEYQRNMMDERAPYVWGVPQVKGLPLQAGSAMEMYMRTNEWTLWRVKIQGNKSHATRMFSGAGSDVRVHWQGWANQGFFQRESCQVSLTLVDAAGHQSQHDISQGCRVEKPWRVRSIYRFPLNDEPEVYVWGQAATSYQNSGLSVDIHSEGAGVLLPLDEEDTVAWQPQVDALQLRLRVRQAGITGVHLSLQDKDGVSSGVWLEAYAVSGEKNGWQPVLIPLQDISQLGKKEGKVQPLDWQHLQYLRLSADMGSAALDIASITVVRHR